MRLLVVEDDFGIREMLKEVLLERKYVVDTARDGQEGWDFVEAFNYDLILLDVMMPKLDGISLCRKLRTSGCEVPIVMMSGKDATEEKVKGLDAGADDYIVKPYKLDELLARIRALLRRKIVSISPILKWGNLFINSNTRVVTYNDQVLKLTPKEYSLLELFMRNSDKLFSRSAILENLWSFEEPPDEDAIKTHIRRLRKKLSKVTSSSFIETVYGVGYKLNSNL